MKNTEDRQLGSKGFNFHQFILNKRTERDVTLREFCRAAELDPSNWSKVERGIADPPKTKDTLIRIAEVLKFNEEDTQTLFDLATIASIPVELRPPHDLLDKLPIIFRTLRGEKPTEEELKNLIEKLKSDGHAVSSSKECDGWITTGRLSGAFGLYSPSTGLSIREEYHTRELAELACAKLNVDISEMETLRSVCEQLHEDEYKWTQTAKDNESLKLKIKELKVEVDNKRILWASSDEENRKLRLLLKYFINGHVSYSDDESVEVFYTNLKEATQILNI